MATGQWLTLADLASRVDGSGKQRYIAEMLSQSITVTRDAPVREGSEIGGHEFVFRTSIPTGYWRQMNQGTPYGKSTTGKARIGMGELVGWSQIDQTLAESSGNVDEFRENEDIAFLEGMGQTLEETFWYGNVAANPAEFMGFFPFYNTLSENAAQNAQNIIDGGGVGSSNASIALINWSARTMYMTYPRGSQAGIQSQDMGNTVPAYDAYGNPFKAYTMWFRVAAGFVPEDWRNGVRIANLDVTNAGLNGPNAPDLFALLSQAVMLPPTLGQSIAGIGDVDAPSDPSPGVRPVLYCNRTIRYFMDLQGLRNRNVLISINDAAGKPQDSFRGIPVKISDRMLVDEARVV